MGTRAQICIAAFEFCSRNNVRVVRDNCPEIGDAKLQQWVDGLVGEEFSCPTKGVLNL
jgi:hypothetical protein